MFRRFFIGVTAGIIATASFSFGTFNVSAISKCDDIKIVWANGSGANINGTDNNYLDFRNAVEYELRGIGISYEFYELGSAEQNGYKYPAVGIGVDSIENFFTALGAIVSGGESYSFGRSVQEGVEELRSYIEIVSKNCPRTKFVLGGLSQGAEVISKSLTEIDANKIIYAVTFGDPKLYLPEGAGGKLSKACRENTASDYRDYVPDCWASEGILGGLEPYEPNEFFGKLGAYCNHFDAFCTGRVNWLNLSESTDPHGSYGNSFNANHIYEIAARKIYNKIAEEKNSEKNYNPEISQKRTNNVAILIDTTGSMTTLIESYKAEALKLARKVWENGGEVALFEYRDISDPFQPRMRCGFTKNSAEKCTEEVFVRELNSLECDLGGDKPESALSASMFAMNNLKWTHGANKSIVILSDAGYHPSEMFEGTIINTNSVIQRSFQIDPVIFFAITPEYNENSFTELAAQTGGKVFRSEDQIQISSDKIIEDMQRFPIRAEFEVPNFTDANTGDDTEIFYTKSTIEDAELKIEFSTNAFRTLIALNDTILGYREEDTVTIKDLDFSEENVIKLIPYNNEGFAGKSKTVRVLKKDGAIKKNIPLVPDCGKAKKML